MHRRCINTPIMEERGDICTPLQGISSWIKSLLFFKSDYTLKLRHRLGYKASNNYYSRTTFLGF